MFVMGEERHATCASSTSVAEKLPGRLQPKNALQLRDERDSLIAGLHQQLDKVKHQNRTLEQQYQRRFENMKEREIQNVSKIDALSKRLQDNCDSSEDVEHSGKMAVIQEMHKSVLDHIDRIQDETREKLITQEKELESMFCKQLEEIGLNFSEIPTDLMRKVLQGLKEQENLRHQKEDDSAELQLRHTRVLGELHEAQALADEMDTRIRNITKENRKLMERFETRQADQECLIHELEVLKKTREKLQLRCKSRDESNIIADNTLVSDSRCESEFSREKQPLKRSYRHFSPTQIEQARLQLNENKAFEKEIKNRNEVARLKRLLDMERMKVEEFVHQEREILEHRTELETCLLQCLSDLKGEILRRRAADLRGSKGGVPPGLEVVAADLKLDELTASDRAQVLDQILSRNSIVQLLYKQSSKPDGSLCAVRAKKSVKLSWADNIMPVSTWRSYI